MSGGKVCCVPNCWNTQMKNPGLTFYSFPNRNYEIERKKLWVSRVRRQGNEKGPWVPTKNSRICAEHFLGGVKSNHPAHENFNPTIFPWKPSNESSGSRRQRVTLRNKKKNVKSTCHREEPPESPDLIIEVSYSLAALPEKRESREISVQTDENLFEECDQNVTILFCWQNSATNDAGTQTSIPISNRAKKKTIGIPIMKGVKRRIDNPHEDGNKNKQKPEILAKDYIEMRATNISVKTEDSEAKEINVIKAEILDENEIKYELVDDIVKEEPEDNDSNIIYIKSELLENDVVFDKTSNN